MIEKTRLLITFTWNVEIHVNVHIYLERNRQLYNLIENQLRIAALYSQRHGLSQSIRDKSGRSMSFPETFLRDSKTWKAIKFTLNYLPSFYVTITQYPVYDCLTGKV